MIFHPTGLDGAYLLEPRIIEDERGFFTLVWSAEEMTRHGLSAEVVQCNHSYNLARGTLRGMHYQAPPHAEVKLIRCTAGRVYDVIVDLRQESPTFTRWYGAELSPANRHILYVPEGFAHGYLTLEDHAEVSYQVSKYYHPPSARGVHWNDPAFSIQWPVQPVVINERDNTYPLLDRSGFRLE